MAVRVATGLDAMANDNGNPNILRTSNGNLFAKIGDSIYKSTNNGATWSQIWAYNGSYYSNSIAFATDGQYIHVVVALYNTTSNTTYGYLYYYKLDQNGSVLQNRTLDSTGSNGQFYGVSIAISPNGYVHIYAYRESDSSTPYNAVRYYISTNNGSSWTIRTVEDYGTTELTGTQMFTVAVDPSTNYPHAFFNQRLSGGTTQNVCRVIRANSVDPTGWTSTTIRTSVDSIAPGGIRYHRKKYGSNIGRVYAVYAERSGSYPNYAYSVYISYADSFTSPWTTTLIAESRTSPWLAEDSNGNLYLFYTDTNASSNIVYVRKCADGSTTFGSESIVVSDGRSNELSVCPEVVNNSIYFLYNKSDGTYFETYRLNQAPDAPTNLSPSGGAKIDSSVNNNFTFRYSDPDGNPMSSYRISYRESGGSWLNTGWVSKSASSGSTVTHTFNAGTFAADKMYEWYVEVRDNAGATSPASATATFSTSQSPTATANSPGSTSVGSAPSLNVRSGVTFSWSYSDPNEDPQAEYELQIVLDSTGAVYRTVTGTGTATSVNVTNISDIGDPVYRWRVRVKDSTGRWSSWSSYRYFKAFQPYQPTGTFEKVLDFGAHTNPATIAWDVSVPSGTSFKMEYALSADGVNYDPWVEVTNAGGSTIPALKRYLKYRATFTASADGLKTPELRSVTISTNKQYYASGEWLSPVYSFTDTNAGELKITWADNVPADTSVQVQLRYGDDPTALGDWETLTKDQSVPANKLHYQFKVMFTSSGIRETTATLNSITMSFTKVVKRGYWQSQVVDVTNAKDLSTGKITLAYESTDAIMIQSRSSTDGGNTFSQWFDTAADGSLRHPPGGHVQVRVVFSGYDSKIDELTLFFDGEASLETVLTGMTPGSEYSFTTLRDTLIVVNGRDAPKKWTGDGNMTDLGGVPPIMSMVVTHHNRVWGVDAQNKSRVRFSDILDPEKWSVLDFFDFNPEDGDHITALMRYGQNLIVSKQRSMALLTGNKKDNYSITWLDSEQGCTGPRAICQADKYVAYVAQDGIRFTDLNTSVIATERLIPSWNNINKRRLNQAAVVYWRNYLLAALPENGSTVNNVVWAFDFLRNAWAIYRGWNVSAWTKFQQYGEEILLAADSMTGQVYQVMTDRYDDSIPVTYKWRSKEFHFGFPERYKLFRNIYLDIEGAVEESELAVTLYVDGEARGTYRTTIPAGEGVKHVRRILPPLYNAVLGRQISIGIEGRCGIQAVHIEYIIRGAVPGGDL